MDWIFDHMQLVIAVAAAFAYWMNARKQKQADEDEPAEAPLRDESGEAAAEAERARRIREEIRRKIMDRADGRAPSAPESSPPPPPVIRRVEVEPATLKPEPVRQPAVDTEMLERQRRLQEQWQEAVRAKQSALNTGGAVGPKRIAPASATATAALSGRGLRGDLRDRASVRRAVVLREVLGPPVGLR